MQPLADLVEVRDFAAETKPPPGPSRQLPPPARALTISQLEGISTIWTHLMVQDAEKCSEET